VLRAQALGTWAYETQVRELQAYIALGLPKPELASSQQRC
jgi:hypothetical protein